MTENHIKEVLSACFVTAMASFCGHKVTDDGSPDYGTDLVVYEIITRNLNGSKRMTKSGRKIELQLKATTEHNVGRNTAGVIKYQLENKAYNDLVERKANKSPQILILFVLPDDKTEWVSYTQDEMITKKHAYWYDIPDTATLVQDSDSRTTISIPVDNQLCFGSFNELFDLLQKRTSVQTQP